MQITEMFISGHDECREENQVCKRPEVERAISLQWSARAPEQAASILGPEP